MSWYTQSRTFIGEVVAETKKATFPEKDELITTTVVVLVTSVIFAAFLWLADQGINQLLFAVFGK